VCGPQRTIAHPSVRQTPLRTADATEALLAISNAGGFNVPR
jgi:hypothetical protein